MGQEHSSGKRAKEAEAYGDVYVKIDQDTYLSDDTLTGTVYVMLRKPYPGDKLCLKVKGKEFTKWIDREQRQRTKEDGTIEYYYVDVPREAEYTSVKHVVDIYDWHAGAVIPPGQFSFPISFKIPAGLASSFFLRSGTTVAEIAYYVEAYLKPERDIYPKIKHKRSITIRQALKNQITTKEVSINQEVTSCCCCSKGTVSMWTAFEKNAYAPGEQARVVTEVDNSKCEVAVTNIRFELVQYIQLSAQGHGKHLNFGIVGENLGSVQPGESFVKEKRKEACIQLPPGIEGSSKSYKGDKGKVEEYSLSPQQAISPSTNGVLVKSNFGLRVSCGMDGCCLCTAAPATELPVTIYSIIQKKVSDPSPPPGWNPTPMPAANLTITINVGGTTVNINTGNAQPQGNPFMANNPMPAQQNTFQPQPQPQIQQQPQFQPQPQIQQQPQYQQPQPQMQQQPQFQQQQQPQYNQQPQFQQQQQQPQFNQQPQYGQQQPQYGQQQPQYGQQQPQYQQQQQQGPPQMNTQGYANNYGNPNQFNNGM